MASITAAMPTSAPQLMQTMVVVLPLMSPPEWKWQPQAMNEIHTSPGNVVGKRTDEQPGVEDGQQADRKGKRKISRHCENSPKRYVFFAIRPGSPVRRPKANHVGAPRPAAARAPVRTLSPTSRSGTLA